MQVQIYKGKVSPSGSSGSDLFEGILPVQGSAEAAGLDVATPYDFTLNPGEKILINTGLIIKPPRDHCILILPRSGLAYKHLITVANSPGLSDRDYCGPEDYLKVGLVHRGEEPMHFKRGERVAQLLFVKYTTPLWSVQSSPDFATDQSRGGFGSTGFGPFVVA